MAGRLGRTLRRTVLQKAFVFVFLGFGCLLLIYEYNAVFLSPGNLRLQKLEQGSPMKFWGHHWEGRVSGTSLHDEGGKAAMATRIAHAAEYCRQKNNLPSNTNSTHKVPQTPKNCKLFAPSWSTKFCPLAKIASTFWVRLFKVLELSNTTLLDSPFSYPLNKADAERCSNASNKPFKPGKIIRGTFLREPFSRVFSAYVDKLLSPNPYLWEGWGKGAMRLDGVPDDEVHCGERVTFRQFLRLINDHLYLQDYHVISMAAQCDPCGESFDFIGKIETFPADLEYFTSLLNVTFEPAAKISHEVKQDAIYDTIQGPISWMAKTKKCVSTQEIGRRIWRKLQIRGLIGTNFGYPFGEQDLSNMTTEKFVVVATRASEQSTDKQALRKQKQQALVEAFRTVPFSDIRKYQEIFKDDFEAFGYDMYPAFIFNRTNDFVDTDALDFNTPWRIPE